MREYLRDNAGALLEEMGMYPRLLDPHYYTATRWRRTPISIQEAHERIAMYRSPFQGWSMYAVDGVFFNQEGLMYEEATQVIRIMFRMESDFKEQAAAAGCLDVLRAILFWTIRRQGRIAEHREWSKEEQKRFIADHRPWLKKKLLFTRQHFAGIAKESAKWMEDGVLFIAYLVRNFADQVLAERMIEEEIWVTSFANLTVNVVKRVQG